MIPSSYQHAIYDWIPNGSGSLIVEAVAGSGKTHSLVQVCRLIPRSQTVRFFAFNKTIADVLKGKVSQSNVIISTYHSAGFQAILRHLHVKIETDRHKLRNLTRSYLERDDYRAYGDDLARLVGMAKGQGIGVLLGDERQVWQEIIDYQDIDFEYLIPPHIRREDLDAHLLAERTRVIDLAREILIASNDAASKEFEWAIDFDDQLYLPILWDLPLQQYDWVLVDEAQDTNRIQRELIRRSLKPGGRLLAVGDRHQAIYGWRGASVDAMDYLQKDFDTRTLPLSVCYRCATSVIDKAQGIVPQIEAAPGAALGAVRERVPLEHLRGLTPKDVILCRNNAPLVKTAYELIANGVACQILGKDIGDGLKTLIYKLHPRDAQDLETRLIAYRDREVKRYNTLQQTSKAEGIKDRVTCITTIIESLDQEERTVDAVIKAIEDLFGDGSKDLLTLSTIHKAKGQEWQVVAIVRSDLLPSWWATKDWQIEQEMNLQYVAWTRAQQELWIMDDEPEWLKKKKEREAGETDAQHRTRIHPDFDALNSEVLGE